MISYRKKFLRIVECWDDEHAPNETVDLLRYFQQSKPLAEMVCREFFTILIDLTRDEAELLSSMKRDTRHEIGRAMAKDEVTCEFVKVNGETFSLFCDYFDRFAEQRSQPKINRSWLSLLANAGSLQLSRACDARGELVWHAYHRTKSRATLLHSASLFRDQDSSARRNFIGRANRLLHWHDILKFKADDCRLYDFGGWYEGKTNQKRLRINQFKEEFGGEIVKNYICERAETIRAKLFLRARDLVLGTAI